MSHTSVKTDTGQILTLREWRGVDLYRDPTSLEPDVLSRSENVDFQRGPANRRRGALKIAQFSAQASQGASRTFGTDAKYATFTPPLIPAGGFAYYLHFTLVWPAAGKTAYVLASLKAGAAYNVLAVSSNDAGVLTVKWTDSAAAAHSLTTAAVANGTDVHLFVIYDAFAGAYTAYVNGAVSGTPPTGLATTLKPAQDAGVVWTFGVLKETSGAVTADSHFDGEVDGFTLFTLRGMRPSVGDTTLKETLRRWSVNTWPTPQQDNVLAHFDMDEASGTVMYDRSRQKNHGAYVGSPTVTAAVAQLSAPCNFIGRIIRPTGAYNFVGSFGNLYYQKIGGVS